MYNCKIELFNNLLYLELKNNTYAYFYDSNAKVAFDMFSLKTGKLTNSGLKHVYNDIVCKILADYKYYRYLLPGPKTSDIEDTNPLLYLA